MKLPLKGETWKFVMENANIPTVTIVDTAPYADDLLVAFETEGCFGLYELKKFVKNYQYAGDK